MVNFKTGEDSSKIKAPPSLPRKWRINMDQSINPLSPTLAPVNTRYNAIDFQALIHVSQTNLVLKL